jgi:hypothetical protein
VKIPYFEKGSAAEFRKWLAAHHAKETELLVGFHKKGSGTPSMTWPESVDEALCFGWIDGVRKRVDEERYTIRFTPRRTRSNWSLINVNRVKELIALERMNPPGLAAFEARRRPDEPLGLLGIHPRIAAFHGGAEVRAFADPTSAFDWLSAEESAPRRRWLLLPARDLGDLNALYRARSGVNLSTATLSALPPKMPYAVE